MKKLLLISLLSGHCYAEDLIYNNGFEVNATVSGTTNGLTSSGLQLNLTSESLSENLFIQSNGNFSFALSIPVGNTWGVSVVFQPSNPVLQHCTLTNHSGVMTMEGVTELQVICTDPDSNIWDEMIWDEGQWQ